MLITVDCGTTNMRCCLFADDDRTVLDEVRRKAGVRNTAFDGTNAWLKQSLHDAVAELLERNRLKESEVEAVISCGTLSSDVGIYRVPHVAIPVGINETASHAKLVTLPEITAIPILFIPGVKSVAKGDEDAEHRLELLDSMSGEECETYGIMLQTGLTGNFEITLPGSYNKAFSVNEKGQIVSMFTGMCGDFIAAMAEHTLLKHSLPSPVIREIMPEKLIFGYDYCSRHGVSPSLIKTRMLRVWDTWSEDEAANFFIGALLIDDIRIAKDICKPDRPLVVGGSNPLRHIFTLLLEHAGATNLTEISDEVAHMAPNLGAIAVYRRATA